MKPRFFALLIVLMTSSLAGIVCLQGYLINDAYKRNKKHFDIKVQESLINTTNTLKNQEFLKHFHAVKKASHDLKGRKQIILSNCQKGTRHSIQKEELHKHISKALDSVAVSVPTDTLITHSKITRHNAHELSSIADYEYSFYQTLVLEYTKALEVAHRVNKHQLIYFLDSELRKNNIEVNYEFAVYKRGILSPVKTKHFSTNRGTTYEANLFDDIDGKSDIELVVDFTGKREYVLESISLMIILSSILTLIIMITFFYAYKLLKGQRKISEIKTDFINNMTHELKTPIATINLALDFIRNPKVINNEEMRGSYLNMIDQENKRIHAQVESVLRISRLERKEIKMEKERVDFHSLINDAILKTQPIIKEKEADINVALEANKYFVLGNSSFLTNSIVNILDNSLKYNENIPKINICSENVKNSIILKIKDNGIGIHKSARKRIFEKFFREFTGDLHNVKGNGLGLSYVKQVIDDHQGEVLFNTEKGKGTEFIIKLPLIS